MENLLLLDKLIAEKVMGYDVTFEEGWNCIEAKGENRSGYFAPSREIRHAWDVVEKLQENWNVNVGTVNNYSKIENKSNQDDQFYCEIYGEKTFLEYAKTASEAICKCALKTI